MTQFKTKASSQFLNVGRRIGICLLLAATFCFATTASTLAFQGSDSPLSATGIQSSGETSLSGRLAHSVSNDSFERMLSSGEYTLAIEAARQSPDSESRLRQVANHQRSHDAISAAIALSGSNYLSNNYSPGNTNSGSRTAEPSRGNAGAGGGQVRADFTSIMNLIQTTIDPLSWEDAGGTGTMTPFTNGVLIDASGRLGLPEVLNQRNSDLLDSKQNLPLANKAGLTFISLPKLEQELVRLTQTGQDIPPSLRYLDGLYDVQYIMLDPANKDLFLVGPTGPWEMNDQGIAINQETGKAVMQLDDLVVCLRTMLAGKGVIGCSIDPRPGQFQQISDYLQKHRVTSEKQREAMRTVVGPQDAVVFGVPQSSHAAHVLLTADYHLKLLAMGHVEAGKTLPSYLDLCGPDDAPKEVIRWWFTLGEADIQKNSAGTVFHLQGNPLQLKTESQMVNRQRAANPSLAAEQFVGKFNQSFPEVQKQFPLYGQLENIFELAIVAQVIRTNDLAEQLNWPGDFLIGQNSTDRYQLKRYRPIKEVELVVNSRKMKFRKNGQLVEQTVTAVSGGVDLKASPQRIEKMTHAIENSQIPKDFLRSMSSIQKDQVDQTADQFRWARN